VDCFGEVNSVEFDGINLAVSGSCIGVGGGPPPAFRSVAAHVTLRKVRRAVPALRSVGRRGAWGHASPAGGMPAAYWLV
jgi:hypothetical protein